MPTRRDFMAASLTRAERDVRAALSGFGRTPLGFWIAFLVAGVLGVSALTIWPFVGLPWWMGLIVAGAIVLVALGEGAYRIWRDLEERLRNPAFTLQGHARSHPV